MSNTEVGELVLQQEVLKGQCIHSISVVSTSVTGRVVVVQHSPGYTSTPVTTGFRVVDDECEYLGECTELVIEPFCNK